MNIDSALALAPQALLVVSLSALGCGGDAAASKPGTSAAPAATTVPGAPPEAAKPGRVASCNHVKTGSECKEFGENNIDAAGEDYLKKFCGDGDFKMNVACPKDKAVGSCTNPEGKRVFYGEGPNAYDAASAEKACGEQFPKGTWKAGG